MYWPVPEPGATVVDWQDDRCGMCGRRHGLVRDHDHETGMVRGYLCARCNQREGLSMHPAMEAWREGRNPATLLGLDEVYVSPWGRRVEQPRREMDDATRALVLRALER